MRTAGRVAVLTLGAAAAFLLAAFLIRPSLVSLPTPSMTVILRPITASASKASPLVEHQSAGPSALTDITLYAGPSVSEFDALAQLPKGAPVLITGRDEGGGWIAIALSGALNGWAPVNQIVNAPDVAGLPIATASRLRSLR